MELTRVRTEDGLTDVCPTCGGCSIGMAVVRKWFAADAINRLWQAAMNRRGGTGKPCPSCNAYMIEVVCEDDPQKTRIDVCRPCMLMWFDPDEQMHVPRQERPPAVTEPELPQAAKEALALAHVQAIAEQQRREERVEELQDLLICGHGRHDNNLLLAGVRALLNRLIG